MCFEETISIFISSSGYKELNMTVPVLLIFLICFNLSLQSKDLLSTVNAHLTIFILDLCFHQDFRLVSLTVNSSVVAVSNEGSLLYS